MLPPFDIHIGPHLPDRRFGIRTVVHAYEIDAGQCGKEFRAQVLRKHRTSRTFVDVTVTRHCDNEHVTFAFSCLEVAYMAGMEEVETAVALDDLFSGVPQRIKKRSDLLD